MRAAVVAQREAAPVTLGAITYSAGSSPVLGCSGHQCDSQRSECAAPGRATGAAATAAQAGGEIGAVKYKAVGERAESLHTLLTPGDKT